VQLAFVGSANMALMASDFRFETVMVYFHVDQLTYCERFYIMT